MANPVLRTGSNYYCCWTRLKLDWEKRMNALNQNNTYRAYVMVVRFIKDIDEMYQVSSIGGNKQGQN